jgi:release factor glutamine methyltransferase
MKTLAEILTLSTEYLKKKGIDKPRLQVEELLSYVLKMPRIELYMKFDRPMVEEEHVQLREAVKRRGEGEPWQYIAGEVEFLGCRIQINKNVLIPRQETEILADKIIKELPSKSVEIWDVCTGPGSVGIAVKKKRPDCKVVLSDLSPEALAIAQGNAALNQTEVELLQGDLLAPFKSRKADIVICNPPYVSAAEYPQLDREVRDWEPKGALVSGPTGYEFYERMARELYPYLNPGAKVYFEIGTGMGNQIKNIFNAPQWTRQELLQDWSSHDRYYKLEIE